MEKAVFMLLPCPYYMQSLPSKEIESKPCCRDWIYIRKEDF